MKNRGAAEQSDGWQKGRPQGAAGQRQPSGGGETPRSSAMMGEATTALIRERSDLVVKAYQVVPMPAIPPNSTTTRAWTPFILWFP